MALNLYHRSDPNSQIDNINPFTVTFDGRLEGKINKKIFLRNDSFNRYYTDITIKVIDLNFPDITDGSQKGFYWKLNESDLVPSSERWDLVSPGNQIQISTNIGNSILGDIVTFIPIWVQVNIPRGLRIQTIKDVFFRINSKESLI